MSLGTPPAPPVTPSASCSSTMDTGGSTPTDLSFEASLDPAEWENAGTPDVFYRRPREEQQTSSSQGLQIGNRYDTSNSKGCFIIIMYIFYFILNKQKHLQIHCSNSHPSPRSNIAECGIPHVFNATVEDLPKMYSYVVKHYIFLRTARMIKQFNDGISAYGKLWDLVKQNWIAFLPLFTKMYEPMTKAAFKALFTYTYSDRGANRREAEEDTIFSWEMVLNQIEDKVTELRFEDLLIFVTGSDEVPPLGFPSKPCIDFYDQEAGQRRLPYASTCMMCLYLPRGIMQEEELHQMLHQATKNSLGFGKV
ncbi:hypothetical protein ABVT39_013589 [Epinephelus coioides]